MLCTLQSRAQEFCVTGKINIPNGYSIGLCCNSDTTFADILFEDTIRNGEFCIKGEISHPLQGTLMTNNLALVERNHWPMDSIHWTYNDIFLSEGNLTVTPDLHLTGTQVQTDYNQWLSLDSSEVQEFKSSNVWSFIDQHPHSVVSLWLANDLLKRGYNLTSQEVNHLEQTICQVPDSMRMKEFRQRIAYAKKTTKGGKLIDLELKDVNGNICHLADIVPQGYYVLVDFWASWCGICIYAMPEVARLANEYKEKFRVIGVSIDKKEDAWRKAMKQHPEPWPQYMTTAQGYDDLFHKYQVGNGVPYYIILTPVGTVLKSPSTPDAVREVLEQYR